MTLESIKIEIGKLPASERAALTNRIRNHDEAAWDEQITRGMNKASLTSLSNEPGVSGIQA